MLVWLHEAKGKWFAYGPADATASLIVPAYPGCPRKQTIKQNCTAYRYRHTHGSPLNTVYWQGGQIIVNIM